ncbi:uncharacterized protein METZ01_LOCUS304538 [marine metagenome]|uniref:Uncharacterized protein n=1 Tax=marine metagenome TaxID=408172 RepID=A0A382MRS4_9ZZZZ
MNLQPADYKSAALPIELCQHELNVQLCDFIIFLSIGNID